MFFCSWPAQTYLLTGCQSAGSDEELSDTEEERMQSAVLGTLFHAVYFWEQPFCLPTVFTDSESTSSFFFFSATETWSLSVCSLPAVCLQTVLPFTITDCIWNLTENLLNPCGLVTETAQDPELRENCKFMPVNLSACPRLHFYSFILSKCFILVRVTGKSYPANTGRRPGFRI